MARYRGDAEARPEDRSRRGILITNLGTPDAPTVGALRRYLREFLWDPRVVEVPRPLWWGILNAFILPFRPFAVSKAYREIWTEEGSPLLSLSLRLACETAGALEEELPIRVGMRYGNPSIDEALGQLIEEGCGRIVHLPLYPQYSAATTGTNVEAVNAAAARYRWLPWIRHVQDYHDHPTYVRALADSVRAHREREGAAERLLLSFHGIPERYARLGDPYPAYCRRTAEALAAELGLDADQWFLTFQSRFGREPWLQPYTDETLMEWGRQGLESVDVMCPGFAVDCLETLEEIAIQNREFFQEAGGGRFSYIPALNDTPAHAQLMAELIENELRSF